MSMLKNTSRKSLCVLHDFPSCKRQLMSLALGCFKTLTNLKMSQWDCSEFDVMCHWRGMHLRLTCSLDDWNGLLNFMLSLDMCCCMDFFFCMKTFTCAMCPNWLCFDGLFVWHLLLCFSLWGFIRATMKAKLVFELVCCQSGLAAAQCSTVGKLLWVVQPTADSARGNSLQRSICPLSAPAVLWALQRHKGLGIHNNQCIFFTENKNDPRKIQRDFFTRCFYHLASAVHSTVMWEMMCWVNAVITSNR